MARAPASRATPWWKRKRKSKENLNGQGQELLDPNPLFVPGPGDAPLSIQDQIKRALRSEKLSEAFDQKGLETFEEADDFDIEDEEDWRPFAPWEESFETEAEFVRPDDHDPEAQKTDGDKQELSPPSSPPEDQTQPSSGQREQAPSGDQ